jgi:hypothetical protein
VAQRWQLKLIRPKDKIKTSVFNAWSLALDDLNQWMSNDLVRALTYGGLGIQGIAETPFYRYISSPNGLSQLGINATEPPRLLEAYEKFAFKVIKNRTTIFLQFGDVAKLKLATPHPASGTGNLHLDSWLEWIIDQETVDSGFVPRSRIPGGAQKAIRLSSPLGGLMVPRGIFGSTGEWHFNKRYVNYDVSWLKQNIQHIEKAILKQAILFLQARLK